MSVYRPKDKAGKPTSPFWHFDFQRRGVRFHGSTGRTTKAEARAVETIEKKRAEAELDRSASIDPTGIRVASTRFWDERGQHDKASSTTWSRLGKLQDGIEGILSARGRPLVLGEITADVIAAYVARRRGQKTRQGKLPQPATINREVQVLRRVMRRANHTWGMDLRLPNWGSLLFEEPEELVVDVPPGLEEQILAKLRPDYRPAMRWLILSGLRLASALPLAPATVDFETNVVVLKTKSRKPGGRTQVLPLTQAMVVLLANELGRHHDAVFTYEARRTKQGRIRGQRYPLKPDAFYEAFKAAAAACGRPELRPHDLRHTAGTRMLRATGNLRAAQKLLNHSRVSTTTKYAHHMVDELRAAMEIAQAPPQIPEKIPEAAPAEPDSALTKQDNPQAADGS